MAPATTNIPGQPMTTTASQHVTTPTNTLITTPTPTSEPNTLLLPLMLYM